MPSIGQRISHYRILDRLGQGGMGDVYLAEDEDLRRPVALKFLTPALVRQPAALSRFRNEARLVAGLSHPNVATIHEINTDSQEPFLVLEYVDGETLSQRLERGSMPIAECCRVGEQIATALEAAHRAGVIHRDLKTSNVMMTSAGDVRVLDFGIGRHLEATRMTRPGQSLGTVGYMSPEQTEGHESDARSDIWALGVSLYECLTGRRPFEGETAAAILRQTLEVEPSRPTSLRPDVPQDLEKLTMQCLEKKPARRPQSAGEVASRLRALTTGTSPVVTRPEGRSQSRGVVLASSIVVVTLVGLALALGLFRDEAMDDSAEWRFAALDFRDLSSRPDSLRVPRLMSLLDIGLSQASAVPILSRAHLLDVRRRTIRQTGSTLQLDMALEVARQAGASHLFWGDLEAGARSVTTARWQLIDTNSGHIRGSGTASAPSPPTLADTLVHQVCTWLKREAGLEPAHVPRSTASLTSHTDRALDHYVVGESAFFESRYGDAQREYARAVAADSTFALAHLGLARLAQYTESGNWVVHLAAAKRHSDRLDERHRDLLRLFDAQDSEDVVRTGKSLLELWPRDHEVIHAVARRLAFHWQAEEAVVAAAQGLRHYPESLDLLTIVATMTDSTEVLERITELDSGNPNAWDNLGHSHLSAGRTSDAQNAFRRALEVDYSFVWSWQGLAACRFAEGRTDQGIEILEEQLRRPDLAPAERFQLARSMYRRPSLARLLLERGQLHEATRVIDREAELDQKREDDPSRVERQALRDRLRAMEHLDLYDRILAVLMSLPSDDATIWPAVAIRSVALNGELDRASDELTRSRERIESHAPTSYVSSAYRAAAAVIELESGEVEAAVQRLQGIEWSLDRIDEPFSYLRLKADAYRRAGRLDDAEKLLVGVTEIWGGYALAHFELGLLYADQGRTAEARSRLQTFLGYWDSADEDLPQLARAREALATLSGN